MDANISCVKYHNLCKKVDTGGRGGLLNSIVMILYLWGKME